jgi:hypothetical protein
VKSRPRTPQAAAVAALELAAYCPGIARPNGLLELIRRQLRNNTWQLRWVETPQMSDSLRAQLPWLISDRLKDEISSGLP